MRKHKILKFSLLIILIYILFYGSYYYKDDLKNLANNILFLKDKYNNYTAQISGDLINQNELNNLEDSGITYENNSFDSTYYPYFNMLNDNEKALYNQLFANIENYATCFKTNIKISINETKNAIEAIYNDHPEFFWLDSTFSYKYTEDQNVVQVILSYNNLLQNIDSNISLFEKKANNIINTANTLTTNYEKEKYVHDILIDNIIYDLSANNNQSAYSALVDGQTVCAGYARAFQYIMLKLGIPTFYVTGHSKNEAHAWNIILLENEYYNIDLTWDDSTSSYTFFNITDTNLNNTHTRNGLSINLPTCQGTKYNYSHNIKNSTPNIKTPEKKDNTESYIDEHNDQTNHNNNSQTIIIPPTIPTNEEKDNTDETNNIETSIDPETDNTYSIPENNHIPNQEFKD